MKKLIDLHYEWMETGLPNGNGLCHEFYAASGTVPLKYRGLFFFLKPTDEDKLQLSSEGLSEVYWASEKEIAECLINTSEYTPLRQTIVLLICAMAGEL